MIGWKRLLLLFVRSSFTARLCRLLSEEASGKAEEGRGRSCFPQWNLYCFA